MSISIGIGLGGGFPTYDYIWMGQMAEEYGVDQIAVGDDLILRPAWPILTLIAEHTKRVQLGPGCITGKMAHPAYHAIHLALLDEISDGRAICGLSRGGFNALIGKENEGRPHTFIRESVDIVRRVLERRNDDYRGHFFTASPELILDFEPLRSDVPIYLGTWGPKGARLAGEICAGITADCVSDPEWVNVLAQNCREGAESSGRNPAELHIGIEPMSCIAPDRDAARRSVQERLAIYYPFIAPLPEMAGIDPEEVSASNAAFLAGDLDRAVELISDRAVERMTVAGTAEDVIPKFEAIIDAGATHISFMFTGDRGPTFKESMEEIGTKIIPYLKKATA